jgi:hypothetical protein
VLNPLSIPSEVLDQLRSLSEALGRLPAIEELLATRLGGLESRLERLPDDIEVALREHFERQREGVETMHGELVANREAAEQLPTRINQLLERIDAMRGELRVIGAEMIRVRETLQPLEGPAERLARLDERLPGGG